MNPQSKQKRIAFGYMRLANNQIAIHEGQAAALKLIYAMYAEGKKFGRDQGYFRRNEYSVTAE